MNRKKRGEAIVIHERGRSQHGGGMENSEGKEARERISEGKRSRCCILGSNLRGGEERQGKPRGHDDEER